MPWGLIVGLTLGAVVAAFGAWSASQKFGQDLATDQARRHADELYRQVILSLERGLKVFESQQTEYSDQKFFQRFVRTSDVYRVTLYNEEGRAFWSTTTTVSRSHLDPARLKDLATGGGPRVELVDRQASEIDQMMRRMPFGQYNPLEVRHVTESMTPVMDEDKFVGAVER